MSVINLRCIHWIQDAIKENNRDHLLRRYPRVPKLHLVGKDSECMDYAYSATRSDLTDEQIALDQKMFEGFKGFAVSDDTDEAMTSLQVGIDNYVKLAQTMNSPLLPDQSISTDPELSVKALQARDRRRNERFLEFMAMPMTETERRDNISALFGYNI